MPSGGSESEGGPGEQSLKSVELDAFYWPFFTTSYFLSRAASAGVKPHASFRRAGPTQTGCTAERVPPLGGTRSGFHR